MQPLSASSNHRRIQAFGAVEPELPLEHADSAVVPLAVAHGPRAIEDDAFPFEALSNIAEVESWSKEINRPIYHIHKWWARRLGTVFRAMVVGAFAPKGADFLELFYQPLCIPNTTVFDEITEIRIVLAARIPQRVRIKR